jgi:hypothetical protein
MKYRMIFRQKNHPVREFIENQAAQKQKILEGNPHIFTSLNVTS